LHQTEAAIVEGKARCAELRAKSANNKFPDRETLLLDRLPAVLELSKTSLEFAALLRQIVKKLVIVPVQDILHGQVHPRIKVTIEFAAHNEPKDDSAVVVHAAVFDVFDAPQHIRNLDAVREFRHQSPNASYREVGDALDINCMTVKRAVHYLGLMRQKGVSAPYIELTTRPARASRWKHRVGSDRNGQASDSDRRERS